MMMGNRHHMHSSGEGINHQIMRDEEEDTDDVIKTY
jgi:hypothetical protein